MIKICICGGGSLGHVCAGVLASQVDVEVNLLTQRPERWGRDIRVTDPAGKVYAGRLSTISNLPAEALRDCRIILLCLPGFAIEQTLAQIRPYVGRAVVGSIVCSTGFFFAAHKVLGPGARLFGFQRVPFIARTAEYGHTANLLGYKQEVAIATEQIDDTEAFRRLGAFNARFARPLSCDELEGVRSAVDGVVNVKGERGHYILNAQTLVRLLRL